MIRIIVMAVGVFTTCALIGGCSKPSPATERPVPPRIVDGEKFPAEYRQAAQDVAASLTQGGDDPAAFHAEVEKTEEGQVLVFHLWHESAFLPENRNVAGNPGGKCRNVWYDVKQNKVIEALFWQ